MMPMSMDTKAMKGSRAKKRIPTINVMPVGKSGPMAQFIKEDIYVSAVTGEQVSPAMPQRRVPPQSMMTRASSSSGQLVLKPFTGVRPVSLGHGVHHKDGGKAAGRYPEPRVQGREVRRREDYV